MTAVPTARQVGAPGAAAGRPPARNPGRISVGGGEEAARPDAPADVGASSVGPPAVRSHSDRSVLIPPRSGLAASVWVKTLPLLCVSTAFAAKDTAFLPCADAVRRARRGGGGGSDAEGGSGNQCPAAEETAWGQSASRQVQPNASNPSTANCHCVSCHH